MDEKTNTYDVNLIKRKLISSTLSEVTAALEERGYNPINQIVGYLISGDPGYISNFKNARSKLLEFDRSEVMAIILEDYLSKR